MHARLCPKIFGRLHGDRTEEDLWGIVGLIHDFDYEKYPSLENHPYKGNEILKQRGWPEVIAEPSCRTPNTRA